MKKIDLNCDLGEGFSNDAELMPFISSANIACGYHAGNASIMAKTIRLAADFKVSIGAHPGFDDKPNFGRAEMHLSSEELYGLVKSQIQLMLNLCAAENVALTHVKPHGALYNMAAKDRLIADTIARAMYDCSPQLVLFGLSNSHLVLAGEALGLTTSSEVFADRTYNNDGHLTPRSHSNALIKDPWQSVNQVIEMIISGTVKSVTGTIVPIKATSVCIHGDGPHAVDFAKLIHSELQK